MKPIKAKPEKPLIVKPATPRLIPKKPDSLRRVLFVFVTLFGITFTLLVTARMARAQDEVITPLCEIVKIIDGDTLRVRCGQSKKSEKVRLADIDAPERGQAHSKRAREHLRTLCDKQTVSLERRGQDARGRALVTLYCGALDINARQVEAGYAWVYPEHVSSEKAETLYALEKIARENKRGLWVAEDPIPPTEYRNVVKKKREQTKAKNQREKKAKNAGKDTKPKALKGKTATKSTQIEKKKS